MLNTDYLQKIKSKQIRCPIITIKTINGRVSNPGQ